MFDRPTIRTASALLLSLLTISFLCCTTIDLYEKITPVPSHEWKSSFKPSFTFSISDTAVPYNIYIVLRHNNKYNYNNIWVTLHTKAPGGKVASAQYELPLANNEKGWLGTGMDDLYEHRIALTPLNERFFFTKGGTYTFTLEHIMREDPLENVMNVGLRIEKKR
jgi:gliding motility-associated lipoprotein GldH